jgi:hypothetical protein
MDRYVKRLDFIPICFKILLTHVEPVLFPIFNTISSVASFTVLHTDSQTTLQIYK